MDILDINFISVKVIRINDKKMKRRISKSQDLLEILLLLEQTVTDSKSA